ncbi:Intramembrane protease RasP/YluC, implicated in cell division based on FtsL cleavage [hydrothermal vent metagenome]|uniref:Intramembrane protease RasP/YluC, implicated in cell division based on FtsL cleavage n=1 Tax=hydrothermal vent metagenome TaxID=652676 RepID=A0A3B0WFE3_9ZZZZ
MTVLWSVLGFIVVMGIVVTIHEWGHYQVARWFNIKVKVFSIGFGKSIYEKQGEETCFKIGVIPLGGYVRFLDEAEGPVSKEELARAFNRQSVYKRFAVVAAGPVVNLVFAVLVFSVMYLVGVSGLKPIFNKIAPDSPVSSSLPQVFSQETESSRVWSVVEVGGGSVYSWQMVHQALLKAKVHHEEAVDFVVERLDTGEKILLKEVSLAALDLNRPEQNWLQLLGFAPFDIPLPSVLGSVLPDGPASQAGLLPQDEIVAINETLTPQWMDLVKAIQNKPSQTVQIRYIRDNALYTTTVVLEQKRLVTGEVVGQMGIGVYVSPERLKPYTVVVQYGVIEAVQQGYQRSVELFNMSLVMLQRMFFGDVSLQHLSGPISIAQFSGQAMQSGLVTFLGLLGLISLSIGLLNLLPIPILDGGHLVYYLIEMVKGSPVSVQIMEIGQRIGIVLIIGLTFVALFNDILRISNG